MTRQYDVTWRDLAPHEVHPSDEREALRVIARKAAQQAKWEGDDEQDQLLAAADAVTQWRAGRRSRPAGLSSTAARSESWTALADRIETVLPALRDGDPVERIRALSSLRTVVAELSDRNPENVLVAEPLTGLAAVIADAMWDGNDNRIGGPRAAARAVEVFLDAEFVRDSIDEI